MKDNRFIDLLNLYIDRQITTEETVELEAEIQNNPKRQAVYRQYCQIHSATKVVYESFRAGATEQPVPAGRPATIELFENRRRTPWVYYAGGLAAAACLALVMMRNNPSSLPVDAPAYAAKTQPVAVAVVAAPAPVAQLPVAVAQVVETAKPGLVSLRNANANPDYSAMLAALREQDEALAANERWQSSRAQSLFEDNMFEMKRVPVTEPEQRTLRRQTAEFTAFQFQR